MYGQPQTAPPSGYGSNAGSQRDRITQALVNIQNPPPVSKMPQQPPMPMQQQPMPTPPGPPRSMGGVPPVAAVPPVGAVPMGGTPQQGMPGQQPGMLGGNMIGQMTQPAGGQGPLAQPPAMSSQY